MNAVAITSVIFDLGRVLIDFDHEKAVDRLASAAGLDPREIKTKLYELPLLRSFEAGAVSPEAFHKGVVGALKTDLPFSVFSDIWNDIFTFSEENSRVYEMLCQMHPHYTLAMLSNINRLHYDYLREKYPVFDKFHFMFASFELGAVKPDLAIYRRVLEKMRKRAAETVYIDDRPEMAAAAIETGMRGFVYTSSARLRDDLNSCGIKVVLK